MPSQVNARRLVSGSRDKSALLQDFWAKTVDVEAARRKSRAEKKLAETGFKSRFLGRRLY